MGDKYRENERRQRNLDEFIKHINSILEQAFSSGDPEMFMTGHITKPSLDKRPGIATDRGGLKVWVQALKGLVAVETTSPSDNGEKLKHLKAILIMFEEHLKRLG